MAIDKRGGGCPPDFAKPVLAIFYVDPAVPLSGGTGHTIRACRNAGVPCVFQEEWLEWLAG